MVILQKRVAGLSESSLTRFVSRARRAAGLRGPINVMVTTNSAVRTLNREFRGKNSATDVLSFPPPSGNKTASAGEIAISADIAAHNAACLGHSPAAEIKILALHGILHLAGFDHERDNGQMARKEIALRRRLNLPVALIERAHPAHAPQNPRGKSRRSAARRTT